ncbi:hypothetical protein JQX13_11900 [Archangium violaceum]|uniref:hypothetical protein n=1 Tax=Archangium violaceum TaxID=83451 RepID=UPI00193B4E70|nr:hypothetical protein [Archangium violaceum]QRK10708.1 hypothetical protein JQX13_11900 [Archangium violaceum]
MLRQTPFVLVLAVTTVAGMSSCASSGNRSPANPLCDGPRGTRAQLQTPIGATEGPRIDEPLACTKGGSGMDRGAYIRVHGQGTRRLVMESATGEQICVPPPQAAPDVCPQVPADAVGAEVGRRLQARGIDVNGMGAGVCAQPVGQDFDTWNYSVGITDWKDADAAVAIVDEVLREWGIGHYFGISVRGIDCTAVPL